MKEKNYNILGTLFLYLTIVVFSIITIIFTIKNYIILAILAFIFVLIISFNNNIKKFPILLFITSFIIRLIVILFAKFPQEADFWIMMDAAQKFANNDYSFGNSLYFQTWAYQTGFVIYQGILFKIFKTEFALKIFNIIFSSLTSVLIYYVSKKLTNEKSARIVSLLYIILPIPLILNVILNNHILSALLMYIGIIFLIKKEKSIKDYIISAILISIGNILRPEGIIVVFSLLVFEVIKLKKDTILDISKKLLVFIIIYIFIGSTSSLLIQKTGINSKGLSNSNPTWKFVLGFNHETCGYYDGNDEKYLDNIEEEKKVVKERIFKDPFKTANLMLCKIDHFWLLSDSNTKSESFKEQTFKIMNKDINYNKIENIALKFNLHIYIVTLFMCFIGVIFNRKKIIENNSIFFVILMITTFFVYLLIEIRPRYTYFIQISIFILASYGYEYLVSKIEKVKQNKMES